MTLRLVKAKRLKPKLLKSILLKSKLCKSISTIIILVLPLSVQAFDKIKTDNISPVESLLPMLMGLGGILAVIFLLAFLLKKLNSFNMVSSHIKVIESQHLGAKEKLVIVEIQSQQLVLGVTPNNINQICQLDQPIVKKSNKMSFEHMMKQLLHPHKLIHPGKNTHSENNPSSVEQKNSSSFNNSTNSHSASEAK